MEKLCSKCGKNPRAKGCYRCKECSAEYAREYRRKNKDHINTRVAQWRKENPEKHKAYCKRWRENLPTDRQEALKEYHRRYTKHWLSEHPGYQCTEQAREYHRNYMREYYRKHKDAINARRREHRLKKKESGRVA